MKKAKPVAISMTEDQQKILKDLAEKTGMSVSRVIHTMALFHTFNAESIDRLKLLDAAFRRSALFDKAALWDIANSNLSVELFLKYADED